MVVELADTAVEPCVDQTLTGFELDLYTQSYCVPFVLLRKLTVAHNWISVCHSKLITILRQTIHSSRTATFANYHIRSWLTNVYC